MIHGRFFNFFFLVKIGFCHEPWLTQNWLCRPGWTQTLRDLPTSALKACIGHHCLATQQIKNKTKQCQPALQSEFQDCQGCKTTISKTKQNRDSFLCSSGCPEVFRVAEARLVILQPPPPRCWDYRCMPLWSGFSKKVFVTIYLF